MNNSYYKHLIIILSLIAYSCNSYPKVTINKQNFDKNSNFYILPFTSSNDDLYSKNEYFFYTLLKSYNTYNVISLSDKEKLLLTNYSNQYKNNDLQPFDVKNISNILNISKGYLVFSSIDKVDIIKTAETKYNKTTNVGSFHNTNINVVTASTTLYYTRITIMGRLSIYDIHDGEELFKATHYIEDELLDKTEMFDCNPIGCIISFFVDAMINNSLKNDSIELFSIKLLSKYYTDIIKRIPK